MNSKKQDFSILNRFEFERQPMGIKFLLKKPAEIGRLNKTLAFHLSIPFRRIELLCHRPLFRRNGGKADIAGGFGVDLYTLRPVIGY